MAERVTVKTTDLRTILLNELKHISYEINALINYVDTLLEIKSFAEFRLMEHEINRLGTELEKISQIIKNE